MNALNFEMNPRTRDDRGYLALRRISMNLDYGLRYVIFTLYMYIVGACNREQPAIKWKRKQSVITRCFSNSRKLNFAVVSLAILIVSSINLAFLEILYEKKQDEESSCTQVRRLFERIHAICLFLANTHK